MVEEKRNTTERSLTLPKLPELSAQSGSAVGLLSETSTRHSYQPTSFRRQEAEVKQRYLKCTLD